MMVGKPAGFLLTTAGPFCQITSPPVAGTMDDTEVLKMTPIPIPILTAAAQAATPAATAARLWLQNPFNTS